MTLVQTISSLSTPRTDELSLEVRNPIVQKEHSISDVRSAIYTAIDQSSVELRELNRHIHVNPEIGYEEFIAYETLTNFLKKHDYTIKEHAYGLETSFEAECGAGGSLVVICAEYDALPNIGHACGHNLIATSSIAAFLGLSKAVLGLDIVGRVRILGTPAEEGGGGKVKLLEAGAFKDTISAAIMAHPMASHSYKDGHSGLAGFKLIASHKLRIEFRGKPAHAGAEPYNGLNALDAAVSAYTNISMLRQQIRPDERIHGVIEQGGTVPNVITEFTRMNFNIRSPTIQRANELLARVKLCFEAAALATGCSVSYIYAPTYMDLRANDALCRQYVEDMADLGERIKFKEDIPATASTDMGNVSYAVPAFHGGFAIPAPDNVTGHNPSFAAAAGTDAAHESAIRCAKGMAVLGYRVLTDSKLADAARLDFETKP
ncbi:hypothetical protein IFR04_014364 [Cadophora malorum]|uniref:Peptidase M20 domain-containing protein 2 n=1 Tax=Cadophora malorum TaxID=108018 RepID=A0A8H7T501_9HELO|nr:hypothetical protein IFR04_014364 [Cadophora malorum]